MNLNLFKNSNKKGETSPDYNVTLSIKNGNEYINYAFGGAWIKQTKNGGEMISIAPYKDGFTDKNGKYNPAFEIVEKKDNTGLSEEEKKLEKEIESVPF